VAGFDGASIKRWDDYEAGDFGGVVNSELADEQTDGGCAEIARKISCFNSVPLTVHLHAT
jgi:hypothetical protein